MMVRSCSIIKRSLQLSISDFSPFSHRSPSMTYDLNALYIQHTDRFAPKRPLILITGNWGEKGCELADGYVNSVLRAGGLPLVLPAANDLSTLTNALEYADGILLSGGADINPLWMDEEPIPQLGGINPKRDAQELLLVRLAFDRQIPMFGICRGMQVMAAALGGKLYQDITAQRKENQPPLLKHSQSAPRSEATHSIQTVEGSLMERLLGKQTMVNTVHHQAVRETGVHFRPTAFAPDGIVEAMESTEQKPLFAVQWHPECLDGETMYPLFDYLIKSARAYRHARRFHEHHLTLDSHCDTPMFFHKNIDFNRRDPQILVDIHKMTEGGLDGSIMVAYLAQQGRAEQDHTAATMRANQIIDRLEAMVESCPEAEMAYTPEQLLRHKEKGKKSIMPALENGYAFGTDLANVAHFRRRGVVYATLCHNGNNAICDSARPNAADIKAFPDTKGAEHGGLSAYGRKVVREMNRVGMMVDLSHAAESSFYHALELSTSPIVCSHSSSYSLCPHPRNLTDHQLRALAKRGGVAQCAFYAGFLRTDPENATIDDAVKHILYMIDVAGIEHVGIGTDFDGDGGVPGLANAAELLQLTKRLQAEGLTDNELSLLWGGNFLRVMNEAQALAEPAFIDTMPTHLIF